MFRKKIIGVTNVDRASQVFKLFEAHTRIGQMRECPTPPSPPGTGINISRDLCRERDSIISSFIVRS